MIKTKRCQYCGKETPFDAAECSHCNGVLVAKPVVAGFDHFEAIKSALSEKYEIVAEIGQGGNATVYQAIQKNLDRKIALKILLPCLVNDPGYLERFHLEARAIAKLRHPNIVTIYDEGNEQGVHFMSMEFLEGKDLHQLVREKGRLRPQKAVEMAKCIAGALDYAHSHGIIHRDVKGSNIIMTPTRTAVLTDFGIAKSGLTSVHTKAGSLLGTPEFMSPEQAGGKNVDSRTDFYSLGVVLYHTLSGHYPFQGESPITTIHKILYEEPVPLERFVKLPSALEQAIDRCLAKDPEKRVRNGKELIELLNSDTVERTRHSVETPAPSPAGQPVEQPARGKGDIPSTRRISMPEEVAPQHPAPKSGEVPPCRPEPKSGEVPGQHPRPLPSELPTLQRAAVTRRPLLRTFMLATVACLALTGYVAWQRFPNADARTKTEKPAQAALLEQRLIPSLIGATKEEAIALLKQEGFEIGGIRVVAVPKPQNRGKVDSQRPSQGSLAKPGTTVDLLIGE